VNAAPRLRPGAWAGWLAALAIAWWGALAMAAEFSISKAAARLQDGTYVLDATIGYQFSPAVLEALENGVPLTAELHLQVRREGAWVWEADVVDVRLRSQIRFSPLLGTYQVTNVDTGQHRSFASRDRAIGALGEVKDLTLARADALDPDETYRVEMRATLDIESLPLPLRPKAYLSPDWNLSSEWSRWRLRP
jgi:hypothetical protein